MQVIRFVLVTCAALATSTVMPDAADAQLRKGLWVVGTKISHTGFGAASAAECQAHCDANPACHGWNYRLPSDEWMPEICDLFGAGARAQPTRDESVVAGLKSRPAVPGTAPNAKADGTAVRTSTFWPKRSFSGYRAVLSQAKQPTPQACRDTCVRDARCVAWAYVAEQRIYHKPDSAQTCTLVGERPLSFDAETSSYAGLVTASRTPPAAAPPAAMPPAGTPTRTSTMTPGRIWMGHGESDFGHRGTKTPQECAAACIQESRCVAWSRLGGPLGTCVFKNSKFVDRTAWTNDPGGASGLIQTTARPPTAPPAPGTAAAPPGIPADPRQAYQAALAANQRNDPQAAIRILTAAIDSGKLDADTRIKAHRVRGSSFFALRRYADAKADYDIVIQANPRDADAYWGRAWINLELGQLDAALADADRSVALGPRSAHGFAMRAKIRAARGEFERAIADRTQAVVVAAAPKDKAQAHIERAETFRAAGRLADGIRDLDLALGLDPESATARLRRGTFHAEAGRYDDAFTDFSGLLIRDPKNAAAAFGRGLTEAYRGRYADAAKDFARYVEVNPGSHLGQILRFLVRERAGEWAWPDLARAAARLDLEKWPSPVIHFLLGNMREAELREAARHEKAETQAAQLCETEFYVGYAALLAGDKVAARAQMEKARDLCKPTYIEATWAKAELARLAAQQ